MQRTLAVAAVAVLLSLQFAGASAAETSGALDRSFSDDGIAFLNQTAFAVAMQSDGRSVVAGGASDDGGTGVFALTRYNRDGTLDPSFSGNGLVRTAFANDAYAEAVAVQPDGRILAAGTTETKRYRSAFALARYLPDGSLDTSFSGDGTLAATKIGTWRVSEISDIALGPNGTIVASAYVDDGHGYAFGVIRVTRRGRPDTTFSGDGVAITRWSRRPAGFAESVAVDLNGSVVAVGSVRTSNNYPAGFAVARYLPDGRHDDSFDGDGKRTIGFGGSWSGAADVGIQDDGKLVIAGTVHNGPPTDYGQLSIALARLDTDGTLDATFAGDGKRTTSLEGNLRAASLVIQSDGKIVLGGEATPTLDEYPTDMAIARYTTHGTLDASFGGDGVRVKSFRLDDWIEGIALQPNGRIVAVGASQGRPPRGYAIARFLP